jgi:hypothetical protein
VNRSKHPDRPPHRRKPTNGDTTRNRTAYRIEASWNDQPDRTVVKVTPDKKAARRLAQQRVDQGAYVILQQRDGFHWRTIAEYNGPALAAERREEAAWHARQAAQERAAARQAAQDAEAREKRAQRREAVLDHLAHVMATPPTPRDATRARHTAGGPR